MKTADRFNRCDMQVRYEHMLDINGPGFMVWATTGPSELLPGACGAIVLDSWYVWEEPPERWMHLPLHGMPFGNFSTLREATVAHLALEER